MASLISHKTHEDAASKGTLTAGRGYRPRRRSPDRRRLPNVLAAIKGREQLRQLRTWGTGKMPGHPPGLRGRQLCAQSYLNGQTDTGLTFYRSIRETASGVASLQRHARPVGRPSAPTLASRSRVLLCPYREKSCGPQARTWTILKVPRAWRPLVLPEACPYLLGDIPLGSSAKAKMEQMT